MAYNLAEAGKAIGVNRSTVLRAIRKGTISATRDPSTGGWLIEASELHRVFPAVASDNGMPGVATASNGSQATELVELRVRLEAAELRLQEKDEQLRNLWQRFDAEAEERRRLTMVLTDMRAAPILQPVPARRRWWRWR
jgi:hypothetical protein